MAISPLNAMKEAPVPGATGADEDFSAKYSAALDKINQTLDARANPSPNYFNVAAGFLKPTRTGSFGESAGNAAEAYGQEVETIHRSGSRGVSRIHLDREQLRRALILHHYMPPDRRDVRDALIVGSLSTVA